MNNTGKIIWSSEPLQSEDHGNYLVVYQYSVTDEIEYDIFSWDGYIWYDMDPLCRPIKWAKIEF